MSLSETGVSSLMTRPSVLKCIVATLEVYTNRGTSVSRAIRSNSRVPSTFVRYIAFGSRIHSR